MIGRRISIILMCLGTLIAVPCHPVDASSQTKAKPKVERDQTIQIVADRLDAYNEKRIVIFTGNAMATQGGRTIRADVLTLYYKEEKKSAAPSTVEAGGPGDVEKVEAKGHVTISEGDRIVTGDHAVYDQDAQRITMTGNAVMREGANVIRGDKILVFLDENRGVVEGTADSRVTATIYPGDQRDKKR
ncbi:MAG: lipopolysaccharide transport periplasmic protein LptA [Deltaproteobacteria bacterium]|nr:lipopolysaccharide transport periplasmic protein LptA [Deltaproteobacteria bacterium]